MPNWPPRSNKATSPPPSPPSTRAATGWWSSPASGSLSAERARLDAGRWMRTARRIGRSARGVFGSGGRRGRGLHSAREEGETNERAGEREQCAEQERPLIAHDER